jgi:hypothetical protein
MATSHLTELISTLLVIVAYGGGFLHGKSYGRRKEYKAWNDEFMPVVKRLRDERDDLWRSAVSKTHKLNRASWFNRER